MQGHSLILFYLNTDSVKVLYYMILDILFHTFEEKSWQEMSPKNANPLITLVTMVKISFTERFSLKLHFPVLHLQFKVGTTCIPYHSIRNSIKIPQLMSITLPTTNILVTGKEILLTLPQTYSILHNISYHPKKKKFLHWLIRWPDLVNITLMNICTWFPSLFLF